MRTIRETLQQADPLRQGDDWTIESRQRVRQVILEATDHAARRSRAPMPLAAIVGLMICLAGALAMFAARATVSAAAIRFEVRLAAEQPVPGWRETVVAGSTHRIYLHPEPIIGNGDIASAQVIEASASIFHIHVRLTREGAIKMQHATNDHLGQPIALLLDDEVVTAPVVRSAIAGSAVLDGAYSRAEAERIARGILAPAPAGDYGPDPVTPGH